MRPQPRHLVFVALAACGGSDFVPDNQQTFVCTESADDCSSSGEDPTCTKTFDQYYDDGCASSPLQIETGTCGDAYVVVTFTNGGGQQLTLFDRSSGQFLGILEQRNGGMISCEVGPTEWDVGCNLTTVQLVDPCPVP